MFNISHGGETAADPDLYLLYKKSLPPAIRNADVAVAIRSGDIDALSTGLLRWCLGVTHARRLKGGDLLDDIQNASLAMLKALPSGIRKVQGAPDHELADCIKGYLETAIVNALLRGRTQVVVEPYRSKKEVEASGRRRIRVSSLDEPVNAEALPGDADFGDTHADYIVSEDRLYPDAVYSAPYADPDAELQNKENRTRVQVLLDGAVPPLSADERAVFTTMRGLVDGVERTAPETAHVLNLTAAKTKQLADQALRKVKAGALGERFFSAPEVANLDKAAEWKVRQGAKRAR
jgi:hypothetical protein